MRWLRDNGVDDIESITSTHIKRYFVSLQDRGLTDHSQHDYARVVRTFLTYCVRDELLEKNPFSKVKMPRVADDLPIILEDDGIQMALRSVSSQRDRLIIRFILDSGIRASELLAMNIADVDLETGIVVVRLGKGQKSRYTTIGAITRREVKKYLINRQNPTGREPLIATEQGEGRLSFYGLMSTFRRMRRDCGVENLTAHTLRRTMATKSLESGLDAYIVARLLGHADLQMLRKYVRLSRTSATRITDGFSVVDDLENT